MRRGVLQTLGNERHLDREEEWRQRRRPDSSSPSASQSSTVSSGDVIPVFVFPAELAFYADDQSSHKQVLTLYNPFVSVLKFKVLSTAPSRYAVVDAEGRVKPQSCIDIVVRHKDISARYYGTTDKFRIEVREEGGRKSVGRKEIASILHPTKKEQLPTNQARSPRETLGWQPQPLLQVQQGTILRPVKNNIRTRRALNLPTRMIETVQEERQGSTRPLSPALLILYVLVGMVCIAFLMLPLQGEMSSLVPENFHVTVTQKLVSAYVLGLLTMVFLQG